MKAKKIKVGRSNLKKMQQLIFDTKVPNKFSSFAQRIDNFDRGKHRFLPNKNGPFQ